MSDIIKVQVSDLRHWAGNYKRHPERQVTELAQGLRQFGQFKNIVVWNGEVIAGNGLLDAMVEAGIEECLVQDYSHLSQEEAEALAVYDNEVTRLGEDDHSKLASIIDRVRAANVSIPSVDDERIKDIVLRAKAEALRAQEPQDAEPQIDKAEELREKWGVQLGDVWELPSRDGQSVHRIVCGDCTEKREGDKAQLVFTSPPYWKQRDYELGDFDWNDLMQGCFAAINCTDDAQILVNLGLVHDGGEWFDYWRDWVEFMRGIGWRRFGWYVWDQGAGLPGDWAGRLAPCFEFVFHFNKQARKPNKTVECVRAGDETGSTFRKSDGSLVAFSQNGARIQSHRIQDSVVRISRHNVRGIETSHPAVFSVAFAEELILAYSNTADIVLDPFLGSGTTLIACENLGRACRGIEIAPKYVAVALERYFQAFGIEAVRVTQ